MIRALIARRSAAPRVATIAALGTAIRAKHTLPDLPYDYSALEPVISAEIMQLHHSKHHQAYVTNFNLASEQLYSATQEQDIAEMVRLQAAIKFNGGGHLNHSIFWTNLAPIKNDGGVMVEGSELSKAVDAQFGSLDKMIASFNATTAAVQGSGWGWLGFDSATKALKIATTANQDPLQPTTGLVPLLGIDVWEHAYYLDYKNARPDYLKAIWQIVNWKNVSERFNAARQL